MKTFKNIFDFQREFSTEEKCREYLEQQRWEGTSACPFCGSLNVRPCWCCHQQDLQEE